MSERFPHTGTEKILIQQIAQTIKEGVLYEKEKFIIA